MGENNAITAIFDANEREANHYVAQCLRVLAAIAAASWGLNLIGIFAVPASAMNVGMPLCILFFLIPTWVWGKADGTEDWIKYLMLGGCVAGITVLSIAMPKHAVLAWMAPVLLSSHYYDRPLTTRTMIASVVCLWISIYASMFMGEGDPNLLGGKKIAEAVINATVLKETTIFFVIPRTAIILGLSSICLTVDKRTWKLMEQQAEDFSARQHIEAELNVAANIQVDMLPTDFSIYPDRTEFELYASMDPAKEVGGDFYDFYLVDDDHLCITVADVAGKGVPAALFMARSMTALRGQAMTGISPAEVLSAANEELCRNNEGMFVTVWLGILELSTGKLTYVNGGHEYPLVRQEGVYRYIDQKANFVVGGMEGMQYVNRELMLQPGDMVFQFSDGVTEAHSADKRMFGYQRLSDAVNEGADLGPEALLAHVKKRIDEFVGEAEQWDDITMIGVTYQGR